MVVSAMTKRMIVANVKPASEYLCSNIYVLGNYLPITHCRKKAKFGGDGKSYQLCR